MAGGRRALPAGRGGAGVDWAPSAKAGDLATDEPGESAFDEAHDRVAAAAAIGEVADFTEDADPDDLREMADEAWEARTIDGRWLGRFIVEAVEVHHRGVRIRGARIRNGLDLEGAAVEQILVLERCLIDGGLSLRDASSRRLDLSESVCSSILASRLHVDGDLTLERVRVDGGIELVGAQVDGSLSLGGARLQNADGYAFSADRVGVSGGLFARDGFEADGEVRLLDAQVDGPFDITGAKLRNAGGIALHADALRVNGVFLAVDGFEADGEVRLLGAQIDGPLVLWGAKLRNGDGYALNADRIHVSGGLFADGFEADGQVRLIGAQVGGSLSFRGAKLRNAGDCALDCESVRSASLWLVFSVTPVGVVDLTNARVGAVYDTEATWPEAIRLGGFTYDEVRGDPPIDRAGRLRWLARDPSGYSPQVYDQLVAMYRRLGQEEDARAVAIEKQRRRRATLDVPGRAWGWLLDGVVGYGYRPGLAGLWFALCWLIGCAVYAGAYPSEMHPANSAAAHPQFHAAIYSLDVLLPIVDLHQESAWIPHGWSQDWTWFAIVAGWVLSTALVAGLSGILRKD